MERRIVYDSDDVQPGRCPACGKRFDRCACQEPRRPRATPSVVEKLPRDGVVRILRDRKGRGGKTVSVIVGVPGRPDQLAQLTSELKRMCGTGGTLRGEVIEIQGDHRERLQAELTRRGYRVKLAGG
ncbi:MAG TPA: stress response translation initiation inhibitor YciH [Chloroflexota bacterium]|nr:stress response translation initiation inhibitor YciH [Chloroflexota bacterium]